MRWRTYVIYDFNSSLNHSITNLQHIMFMKRIMTFCVSLLMALGIAQAQSFDFGIVAGMNLTKLQFSGNDRDGGSAHRLNSDAKCGWYVGPKMNFSTVIGLGVDAALQYSERDLDIEGESTKYRTIEIPINLRYNIGLGKTAGIYIATGPQFGFALQNMRWDNFGSGTNFDRSNMNTTWNIGAGVRLLRHLEIGVGYNFALSRTGKNIFENFGGEAGQSNDYELRYRANSFQVQVAYMF